MKLKNFFLLLLVILATAAILIINLATRGVILFDKLPTEINHHVLHQSTTLLLTLIVLIVLRFSRKETFQQFFRLGNIASPIKPESWIGLHPKSNETWREVGRNFAIIITLITAVVMYFQVFRVNDISFSDIIRIMPFVLLFALSNSFVEESITRLGVVVSLHGTLSNQTIQLVSAAIFGIVHYWGSPGGIIGVIVAAFLGWFLAKSIIETKGIFWAWMIHFLQDVVIFSAILV